MLLMCYLFREMKTRYIKVFLIRKESQSEAETEDLPELTPVVTYTDSPSERHGLICSSSLDTNRPTHRLFITNEDFPGAVTVVWTLPFRTWVCGNPVKCLFPQCSL